MSLEEEAALLKFYQSKMQVGCWSSAFWKERDRHALLLGFAAQSLAACEH